MTDYPWYNDYRPYIEKIVINEGVTTIRNYAFNDSCKVTGGLAIPDSVITIGKYAFDECFLMPGLAELKIPKNVITIGECAFNGNHELAGELIFPNSVTTIGEYAFCNCSKLTGELKLSESLITIEKSTFNGCEGLTGKLIIPETVTTIKDCAFRNCKGFVGVLNIPESMETIAREAFYGCNGLESIYFYNSECNIYDEEKTLPTNAVIYGYANSTAYTYAQKYNRTFKCIEHSYSEWVTDEEDTCLTGGLKYKECIACGVRETEKIPAKGHNEVIDAGTEATCTKAGLTGGEYCAVCGTVMVSQKAVSATGHKLGAYVTTTKAGFGKTGVQTSACSNCKTYKLTRKIAAVKTPVLSTKTYTFNNKVKKPTVTVKNTAGKKMSVTTTYASGRKNVGKYAVKVKLKGANCSGTKTVYFKINPKGVSVSKLSKAKKAFTVKWKKPSATYRKQMTGYQIRYSTSSKMTKAKTVTVKGTKAISKKISKLKAKKKYYVQIRTYKTVKGINYYSGWSKAKYVKTK